MKSNEPYWKYCIREYFIDMVRWDNLSVMVIAITVLILATGWWTLVLYPLFHFTFHLMGGNYFKNFPPPEKKKTKCVAGNINCKICDKEGNFAYKKRKWYNIM